MSHTRIVSVHTELFPQLIPWMISIAPDNLITMLKAFFTVH